MESVNERKRSKESEATQGNNNKTHKTQLKELT